MYTNELTPIWCPYAIMCLPNVQTPIGCPYAIMCSPNVQTPIEFPYDGRICCCIYTCTIDQVMSRHYQPMCTSYGVQFPYLTVLWLILVSTYLHWQLPIAIIVNYILWWAVQLCLACSAQLLIDDFSAVNDYFCLLMMNIMYVLHLSCTCYTYRVRAGNLLNSPVLFTITRGNLLNTALLFTITRGNLLLLDTIRCSTLLPWVLTMRR